MQFADHNASIYGLERGKHFQLVHSDYLNLALPSAKNCQYQLPEGGKGFDAVFLSPPWGGVGYEKESEYSLDYIFPEFQEIIAKSVKFSSNLMLFLPKNTSIDQLID